MIMVNQNEERIKMKELQFSSNLMANRGKYENDRNWNKDEAKLWVKR